jgi:hypothetical protein
MMKLCIFAHRLRAERAEPFAEGLAFGVELPRPPPVCGDRMGSVSGDRVGSVCGDRLGSVCGDCMGRCCGDRMGSVSDDRIGSVSGDRVGCLIFYTELRGTVKILSL